MFGLTPDTIRNIKACFAKLPQIEKVLLYGSRAKNTYKNGSDIDLTLLGKNLSLQNSIYPLMDLLDELYLPYRFDISIFATLKNPNLINHILTNGQPFYVLDEDKKDELPKGWQVKKLGEVCDVNYGTRVVRKRDGGTIYPVYGGGGETFFIDKFNRENNLVVSRFAMSEKCTRFVKGKFFLNDSGLTIKSKDKNLKQNFLDLQIFSLNNLIYSIGRGTAQRNLDIPKFKQFKVFIPPLPEQEKIVAVLDKAFALMDKMKAGLEKNIINAKELFQSKLQQIFSEQGKDWQVKTLGEVCEFIRGLTYKKRDEVNFSNNQVLRANNISLETGVLNFDEIKYINDKIKIPTSKIVKKGSLLICTASGSKKHLGKVALINKDYSYAFGGFMGILNPKKNEINSKYFWYQTRSRKYLNFILNLTDGANINNLRFSQLSEYKIPLPPLPEQEKIVTVLDELKEKTLQLEANYQQELLNLQEMKKVFLDKAFKGEL